MIIFSFVCGHYLFRDANSSPRAKLDKNYELRGTDYFPGQICNMQATVFIFPAIFPEKPKVTCSVALGLAFLSAENGNRQQEDLSLIDFGRLSERVLSVRTKSINKNFLN